MLKQYNKYVENYKTTINILFLTFSKIIVDKS